MNWEAIGAIGEAISALAFIGVIVQVRLSTSETLRSIREDRSVDARRTLMDTAQSEWLNRVVAKGFAAFNDQKLPFVKELIDRGLAPEEAGAFDSWCHSWFIADTENILQIDKLAPAERRRIDYILREGHRSGARRQYLEMTREALNADAVRYIDNLLAQPSSTP